jgi:adenine-specific DNA-methyltransferase
MANLSQIRREQMISFLETLKEQHNDDASLIAINQIEQELTSKKYGLVWEEHEEDVDIKMQTNIPVFTEVKEKEIAGDSNCNLFNFLLEGDNLHSLKLLEKTHKGKIDVIYIDPPYNTGNKDFVYNDTQVAYEDTFRHSKWLSYMAERLKIAKKLLTKQGMLFISIDDNEYAQLKLLCDSILGEQNYITSLIWQKKKGGGNDSRHVATEHEYVLFYAFNKELLNNLFIPYGDEYITRYKEKDEKGRFFWDTFKRKSGKQYYAITCPDGTILDNDENGEPISWLRSESRFLSDLEEGEVRIIKINNKWSVHFKQRQPEGYKPRSLITEYGTTSDGAAELKKIFNLTNAFSNPKPVNLIKYFIKFCSRKDAIVLDFFAGSGTTGQAVLELNKEDDGNRKFILCTNNENNICEEVTYQRIKTVVTGQRADGSYYSDGLSANLKYYKTEFVAKESEEIYDDLLEHIVEMIQINYGIKMDNQKYVMIMDDDEMDEFEKNFAEYSDLKAVFINQDVLFSTAQEKLLQNINTFIIPDCYFDFELREVGELW